MVTSAPSPAAFLSPRVPGHRPNGEGHSVASAATIRILNLSSIFLVAAGCAPTQVSMDSGELVRLKDRPVIHVVHYVSAPLVARTPGRTVLGAAIGGVIGGVAAVEMAKTAGEKLKKEYSLEDPAIRVAERLVARLSSEAGLSGFRVAQER